MNRANQTEAYIEKHFTSSQHTWLRAEARRIDSSKLGANRRASIVTAQIEEGAKNKATLTQHAEQRHKREEHVASIKLVLNPTEIQKLTGAELHDQIKVHRNIVILPNGQAFPVFSRLNVADKRVLVTSLAQCHLQNKVFQGIAAPGAST